jgi:hypothetical protein
VNLTSTSLTIRANRQRFICRQGPRKPPAEGARKTKPGQGEERRRKSFPGLWLSSFCVSAFSLRVSVLLLSSCVSVCLCVSAPCFSGALCLPCSLRLSEFLLFWLSVECRSFAVATWNCNDSCGVRAHALADWRLEPAF